MTQLLEPLEVPPTAQATGVMAALGFPAFLLTGVLCVAGTLVFLLLPWLLRRATRGRISKLKLGMGRAAFVFREAVQVHVTFGLPYLIWCGLCLPSVTLHVQLPPRDDAAPGARRKTDGSSVSTARPQIPALLRLACGWLRFRVDRLSFKVTGTTGGAEVETEVHVSEVCLQVCAVNRVVVEQVEVFVTSPREGRVQCAGLVGVDATLLLEADMETPLLALELQSGVVTVCLNQSLELLNIFADVLRKDPSQAVDLFPKMPASLYGHFPVKRVSVAGELQVQFSDRKVGVMAVKLTGLELKSPMASLVDLELASLVIDRESPLYGAANMAACVDGVTASLKVVDGIGEVEITTPVMTGGLSLDGWTFWIRALLNLSGELSEARRPDRVLKKNELFAIFHEEELLGNLGKHDQAALDCLTVKTPLVLRLSIPQVELRCMKDELVRIQGLSLVSDNPGLCTQFSMGEAAIFDSSQLRLLHVASFCVHIPVIGVPFQESTEGVVRSNTAAKVPLRGPPPVVLTFRQPRLTACVETLQFAAAQTEIAFRDMARWEAPDFGRPSKPVLAKYFKPIEIKAESCQIVDIKSVFRIDIADLEMAFGPTKHCMAFAFYNLRAWSPAHVWVSPFLVRLPEQSTIRLKAFKTCSLDDSQDLGHRHLDLSFPSVKVAITPGLRAFYLWLASLAREAGLAFAMDYDKTPRVKPPITQTRCVFRQISIPFIPRPVRRKRSQDDIAVRPAGLRHVGPPSGHVELALITVEKVYLFLGDLKRQSDILNLKVKSGALNVHVPKWSLSVAKNLEKVAAQFLGHTPVSVTLTGSIAAVLDCYEDLKDCGISAWELPQLPSLNHVLIMNSPPHPLPATSTASTPVLLPQADSETPASGSAVSITAMFRMSHGFSFTWRQSPAAGCAHCEQLPVGDAIVVEMPGPLEMPAIFHGFPTVEGTKRYLKGIGDEALLKWLHTPWEAVPTEGEVGGAQRVNSFIYFCNQQSFPGLNRSSSSLGTAGPGQETRRPGPEVDPWETHWELSQKIQEYLQGGGSNSASEGAGRWCYGLTSADSPLKFVDTPMYFQLSGNVQNLTVHVNGQMVGRVDAVKLRGHLHNFPLQPTQVAVSSDVVYGQPPILLSWWAEVGEKDAASSAPSGFDILPERVVPLLLKLVGTSEELRRFVEAKRAPRVKEAPKQSPNSPVSASSSSTHGRMDRMLTAFVRSLAEMSAVDLCRLILRRMDFSFCLRLLHLRGRLGGLRVECEVAELRRDFEFTENSGFVTGSVKRAFVGYDTVRSLTSAGAAATAVLPFCELSDLKLSLAIKTELLLTPLAGDDADLLRIFVSATGARVFWSPALQRAVRQLLTRTDALVRATRLWKDAMVRDLLRRKPGRGAGDDERVKTVHRMLNSVMLLNRRATVIFSFTDMQTNFHATAPVAATAAVSGAAAGATPTGGSKPTGALGEPGTLSPAGFRAFLRRIGASDDFSPSDAQGPGPGPGEDQSQSQGEPLERRRQDASDECVRCWPVRMSRDDLELGGRNHSFLSLFAGLEATARGVLVSEAEVTLASVLLTAPLAPGGRQPATAVPAAAGTRLKRGASTDAEFYRGLSGTWVRSPTDRTTYEVKPRGSQLVLVTEKAVLELKLHRKASLASGAAVALSGALALVNLTGSVAPTSLRGLLWLDDQNTGTGLFDSPRSRGASASAASILRSVLQISKVNGHIEAEMFPFRALTSRVLVPKLLIAADSEAFFIVLACVQDCLLYRGVHPAPAAAPAAAAVPAATGDVDELVRGLLAATTGRGAQPDGGRGWVQMEYKIEQIGLNLINKDRVALRLTTQDFIGSHRIELNQGRQMSSEFELRDALLVCADGGTERVVLRGANSSGGGDVPLGGGGSVLLRIRGKDKFVHLREREWQVYDSIFLALAPVVIDISQELFDEMNDFFFPQEKTGSLPVASPGGGGGGGAECLFKYFRVSPIDCIVSYGGKRVSIHMLSIVMKPYVKKRKLSTWRKLLQAWGGVVGQQVLGSVVAHPFKRKKGLQETLKAKFQGAEKAPSPGKLLFGKYAV